MKKIFLFASIAVATTGFAQKIARPTFKKGQQIEVTSEMHVVPENLGPKVNSTIVQVMNIQDATATATTFEQKVKSLKFDMDMMGQGQSFDSQKSGDLDGEMGKSIKPALETSYIISLDGAGTVTAVKSSGDAKKDAKTDDMMAAMIQQLSGGLMSAPKAGSSSIFKILPDKELKKGDTWTVTPEADPKGKATYTVTDITPNEVVLDFTSEVTTDTKQEMMGMEAKINKKDKTKGTIKIDAATGLLKSQSTTTTSEGMVDAMGQSIPLNNTVTATTTVKTL
jgi:hypothetical protein